MAYKGKDFERNPARNKDGLMKQEAIFAENVPKVGPVEAAAIAYPDATPESQVVIASKNMGKEDIVLSISKTADRLGLTRESCVETIKNNLEAEKVFVDEDGNSHYTPNGAVQLKAAELGLKLHGHLKDNAVAIPIPVSKEQYMELCKTFWGTKPT